MVGQRHEQGLQSAAISSGFFIQGTRGASFVAGDKSPDFMAACGLIVATK